MAGLRGTPAERAEQKAARRRANQIEHVRGLTWQAMSGHDYVVAATQAAKAASRRMTDEAQRMLAGSIVQAITALDVPANWRLRR